VDKGDLKAAQRFAARLRERMGNEEVQVILYGSRARRDSTLFSDMDICIIGKEWNKELRDKIYEVAWEVSFEEGMVIVPVIFEEKEWLDSPLSESPFCKAVRREGIKL